MDRTTIALDKRDRTAVPTVKADRLHLLPCNIHHDGTANIHAYFTVTKDEVPTDEQGQKGSEETFQSCFRGRGLRGVKVPVPKGYTGSIYTETKPPRDVKADRFLRLEHQFDGFVSWRHGDLPTIASDDALSAMSWLEIAEDVSTFRERTTLSFE
ncbi:Ribonuclease H2 subunit C [Gaertneriomyces sp. JEL0708]|nr:Ribonuclease H2 subunit C [Gaertneriomyces sp. JEL0708]